MAFIGPDSDKALRTAIAAGEHDHLWDVVHGLYASQGAENAGWVTDELVRRDRRRSSRPRRRRAPLRTLGEGGRSAAEARSRRSHRAGVHSTPAFQIGPTGGRLELVQVSSLGPDGIRPAIEALLAR